MTRWARLKNRRGVEAGSKWEKFGSGQQASSDRTRSALSPKQRHSAEPHADAGRRIAQKQNKRSENRRLKRQRRKESNKVCFHCRMPGHGMADCPILSQDNEQGTGICFKCGSTEHKSHTCTAKVEAGKEFMFAKCFICGEEGHLSKTCPDNPRGLYPNGGCCKLCGSVDHYRRDCPERPIKGEVTAYRVGNSAENSQTKLKHVSMDDEIALYEDEPDEELPAKQKRPKVVKF